jgi:hypothetical protein
VFFFLVGTIVRQVREPAIQLAGRGGVVPVRGGCGWGRLPHRGRGSLPASVAGGSSALAITGVLVIGVLVIGVLVIGVLVIGVLVIGLAVASACLMRGTSGHAQLVGQVKADVTEGRRQR